MALARNRYRIYRSYANRVVAVCAFDVGFTAYTSYYLLVCVKGMHAGVLTTHPACIWEGGFQKLFYKLLGHLGDRDKSIFLRIGFLEFLAGHEIDESFSGVFRRSLGIHAAERQDFILAGSHISE